MVEIIFGMAFSNHVRSSVLRTVLKITVGDFIGISQWIVNVKYPNDVKNE